MKSFYAFVLFVFVSNYISAQNKTQTDSVVNELLKDQVTPGGDQGVTLIKNGDFEGANQFFSSAIKNDESDREAYFKRGVANYALNDTLSACRDWSAVLALGDTEMFNLLESKCHSSMIIADDTIPAKQYKKMWAINSAEPAGQNAKTVVEVMPAFPGGQEELFKYISTNQKKPDDGKHGTVYVNFLISPKGKILYPYVTRGLGGKNDKEAIRLVRSMPAWTPGKQKGKAVYVRSNLAVRF